MILIIFHALFGCAVSYITTAGSRTELSRAPPDTGHARRIVEPNKRHAGNWNLDSVPIE